MCFLPAKESPWYVKAVYFLSMMSFTLVSHVFLLCPLYLKTEQAATSLIRAFWMYCVWEAEIPPRVKVAAVSSTLRDAFGICASSMHASAVSHTHGVHLVHSSQIHCTFICLSEIPFILYSLLLSFSQLTAGWAHLVWHSSISCKVGRHMHKGIYGPHFRTVSEWHGMTTIRFCA